MEYETIQFVTKLISILLCVLYSVFSLSMLWDVSRHCPQEISTPFSLHVLPREQSKCRTVLSGRLADLKDVLATNAFRGEQIRPPVYLSYQRRVRVDGR